MNIMMRDGSLCRLSNMVVLITLDDFVIVVSIFDLSGYPSYHTTKWNHGAYSGGFLPPDSGRVRGLAVVGDGGRQTKPACSGILDARSPFFHATRVVRRSQSRREGRER